MDLYQFGRALHISVGVVTLGTFWIAALAHKGGVVHRRAGGIYLLSLVAILATSFVMLVARLRLGDASTAAFIAFLTVYIGTSAWLARASIRSRQDPTVGLIMGTAMWRMVLRGPRDHRWWLEQHMNAATANFAATHGSFLSLAVASAVPALRHPLTSALVNAAVILLALTLRIWLGRRYLGLSRRSINARAVPVVG